MSKGPLETVSSMPAGSFRRARSTALSHAGLVQRAHSFLLVRPMHRRCVSTCTAEPARTGARPRHISPGKTQARSSQRPRRVLGLRCCPGASASVAGTVVVCREAPWRVGARWHYATRAEIELYNYKISHARAADFALVAAAALTMPRRVQIPT